MNYPKTTDLRILQLIDEIVTIDKKTDGSAGNIWEESFLATANVLLPAYARLGVHGACLGGIRSWLHLHRVIHDINAFSDGPASELSRKILITIPGITEAVLGGHEEPSTTSSENWLYAMSQLLTDSRASILDQFDRLVEVVALEKKIERRNKLSHGTKSSSLAL